MLLAPGEGDCQLAVWHRHVCPFVMHAAFFNFCHARCSVHLHLHVVVTEFSFSAHISCARSLMLMARSPAFNDALNHSHHHRHRQQQQQQQQQQQRIAEHVNSVIEWAKQARIPLTSSLRCDALKVLSTNGNGVENVRVLVQRWKQEGIKLSEKEYVAVLLAESNAAEKTHEHHGRGDRDHPQHRHIYRRQLLDRISHILTCAAADDIPISTPIMNAALVSTSSPCSFPPLLSQVCACIPSPPPPPDAMTLDIVACAHAAAAAAAHSDSGHDADAVQSEQILLRIFSSQPVSFFSHSLPPPSQTTLTAAVKTLMRRNHVHLAMRLVMTTCDGSGQGACVISSKACKIISDGLRRGVAAKVYALPIIPQWIYVTLQLDSLPFSWRPSCLNCKMWCTLLWRGGGSQRAVEENVLQR
jgi:hypothetical protein